MYRWWFVDSRHGSRRWRGMMGMTRMVLDALNGSNPLVRRRRLIATKHDLWIVQIVGYHNHESSFSHVFIDESDGSYRGHGNALQRFRLSVTVVALHPQNHVVFRQGKTHRFPYLLHLGSSQLLNPTRGEAIFRRSQKRLSTTVATTVSHRKRAFFGIRRRTVIRRHLDSRTERTALRK